MGSTSLPLPFPQKIYPSSQVPNIVAFGTGFPVHAYPRPRNFQRTPDQGHAVLRLVSRRLGFHKIRTSRRALASSSSASSSSMRARSTAICAAAAHATRGRAVAAVRPVAGAASSAQTPRSARRVRAANAAASRGGNTAPPSSHPRSIGARGATLGLPADPLQLRRSLS